MKKKIPLTQMKCGQSGIVVEIQGGINATHSIEALGIRRGVKLRKVCAMLLRGPVTVQVANMHVGIGFGRASKIIMEVEG